eukprot:3859432-Pleurochrysis_carterae.AAC.5
MRLPPKASASPVVITACFLAIQCTSLVSSSRRQPLCRETWGCSSSVARASERRAHTKSWRAW